MSPKRLQSQTERDIEGLQALQARRDREAAPVEVPEEITGQHEGEELAELRSRRPVHDRLGRLEQKHDDFRAEVDKRLNAVELVVADVGGQMKVIPRLVDAMENATKALQERDHVTLTAKVEVDKAKKLSDVKVGEQEQLDAIQARKDKRNLLFKVAGGAAASTGIVLELLHRVGVL